MNFLGIDPGLTGAIALINEGHDGPLVWDMPAVAAGRGVVKREVDGRALGLILEPFGRKRDGVDNPVPARAVLERTSSMPGQGVASMFSMGVSRGIVLGVMGALQVPYLETGPLQWKKHFGLLGADKEGSRKLALRLYPQLAKQLARKRDHNRAEAVLLAAYAQKTWSQR